MNLCHSHLVGNCPCFTFSQLIGELKKKKNYYTLVYVLLKKLFYHSLFNNIFILYRQKVMMYISDQYTV